MIKNVKKFGVIALTMSMLLATTAIGFADEVETVTTVTPAAQEQTIEDSAVDQEENGNYLVFNGEITAVAQSGEGAFGFEIMVASENPQNGFEEMRIGISENTTIVKADRKVIEEGDKISVVYGKNQPMTMSLPPLVNADVIVVGDSGYAKASIFDEEFLSADNELKLNISEDTIIQDLAGNAVAKEAIIGKDVVVMHDFATMSIPAQTNPSKIIVMEGKEVVETKTATDEDSLIDGEVVMVELRASAEELGYNVVWVQESQSVIISKEGQAMNITVTIGEKSFGYNRAIQMFENAPEIRDGKTFVESTILDLLK